MNDQGMVQDQLLDELAQLRQRVAELETLAAKHQHTEEALRHERDLVARLMETSPLGIVVVNKSGQITFANHYAELRLGLTRDELTRRTYNAPQWRISAYNGSPFPDEHLPFPQVMTSGKPVFGVRHAIELVDGQRVLLSINAAPLFDEVGQASGMVATLEDVTEHVRAEDALRRSEATLKSILRVAPIGIGLVRNRVFQWTNDTLQRMLGYSAQELDGQSARMLYESDEEFERVGREKYKEIAKKGTGTIETRFQCKDGKILDILLSSTPLDSNDLLAGTVFTALDISEREQAKEAIREERDWAQKYLDVAGVMLMALNERGEITLMNRMGHAILGYEEGELLGQNWFDACLPARIRDQVRRVFYTLMSGEIVPVESFENPVLTKAGQERIVAWRNTLLTDDLGKIVGTLSSGEDISARRHIEEALRESEAKHRNIVESIPMGMHMYELAPDGQLVFMGANPAADAILGVKHHRFVGQAIEEAFPPLSETEVPDQYRRVAAQGGTWHADQILFDRGEIAGAFEVHAFQTAPGKMTAAFLDVTSRKQAEEALHQRTQQLEALRQVGLEIAAQLDIGTLLHSIVTRAADLVGGSSGGLYLYRPERDVLEWMVAIGPGLVPIGSTLRRGQGLSGKVWETGQPLIVDNYEQWEGRAEGYEGYCFAATVGVPVQWGAEFLGVLNVLSDTPGAFSEAHTDLLSLFATQAAIAIVNARLFEGLQHRMEELRNAQAQLVQTAKMAAIGELAAGVAHELNNPLTSVLGFAELSMNGLPPDDPIQQDLATVVAEARRARDVVRNLLAFSRQGESFFERSDVNRIVQETLALIRRQLEDSGVMLKEHYASDLPLIPLANTRMKQVFLNLFTNALHAMPQGGTLTVLSERVGDEIAIRVIDTGVGISPKDLPHVFEPFFTTKSAQQGTGLGLSVSLSIVREHGGRIEVTSSVGAGSTLAVWLPVEAAAKEVGHGR